MLYGSGDEKIEFSYVDAQRRHHASARTRSRASSRTCERRYRETESHRRARGARASTSSTQPLPGVRRHAPESRRAQRVRRRAARCRRSRELAVGRRAEFFSAAASWRAGAARSPRKIVKEIGDRLRFLADVGLDYLTLDRSADTLSGGEAQRIRLASQIGSGLVGVMYILDEPSIGLHQRDNERLLRHAESPARPRQHRARRRARRRSDPPRRLRRRPRPRRRRARRPGRRAGHAGTRSRRTRLRSPASTSPAQRAIAIPPMRTPRSRTIAALRIVNARGNNLQDVDRRHSRSA